MEQVIIRMLIPCRRFKTIQTQSSTLRTKWGWAGAGVKASVEASEEVSELLAVVAVGVWEDKIAFAEDSNYLIDNNLAL
jgi:hypothetical protein